MDIPVQGKVESIQYGKDKDIWLDEEDSYRRNSVLHETVIVSSLLDILLLL